MEKKTLLIFDIDGTLTNSVAAHQTAFVEALKKIGVEYINDNFKSYKHHTDSYIAREIYEADVNRDFSSFMLNEFEDALLKFIINKGEILEIRGAKEMIEFCEINPNVGICFATGSLLKPAEYKLNQIGIHYHSEQLVASNNIESREGIVNQAITQAKEYYKQTDFENIISFGDGLWDLKTAQNLSLDFVGIGEKNKGILFENGMDIHFNDWTNHALHKILP